MGETRKPLILTLDPLEPSAAPQGDASARVRPSRRSAETPVEGAAAGMESAPAEGGGPRAAGLGRRRRGAAPQPSPPLPDAPPSTGPARKAAAERAGEPEGRPRPPQEAGPFLARWAYPFAAVAAALWAGCLVTFVVGYEHGAAGFAFAPVRWAVTALLAFLPAALLLMFGYLVRQSARLAEASRRAAAMADALAGPAALAGAHAHGIVGIVREEIARAQAAADEAARRMAALGDSLAEETRRVTESAVQAERAASRLGGRLQGERAELASLSGALDAQLATASEGAARHARLAAEASDLAQANLQEAQAALIARTADLAAAAGDAARASEAASGELGRGGDRLERLAASLKHEQAEWASVAQGLLADQDDVAARLETERARFSDAAAEARTAAGVLEGAAAAGTEALARVASEGLRGAEALATAARAHGEESAARLAAARAAMESDQEAALARIARAGQAAAEAAAHTAARAAEEVEAAADAARSRVETLAEAAFAAGQRADQAFDARLTAARRALEAQASLVEAAGQRTASAPEGAGGPGPEPTAAPTGPVAPASIRPGGVGAQAPAEAPEPAPPTSTAGPPTSAPPALRPRLQLASTDDELFAPQTSATPQAPGAASASASDEWSWKDLLTAIDDPQPLDDDALAERMIGEIEAMGVDPGALLPRARIDEIARAVDAGDEGRAREAVRRLAPAAVRRLSRRVLTDKVLRGQADLYRRRYGDLVRGELGRNGGGGGGAVSALLGSDPGRAFLLLDAAVGDLH